MLILETYVNRTRDERFGSDEPYEPWTDDIGELFKDLQREHGRCISNCYVDLKDGGSRKIGWVFEKRQKYTDCSDTYLQETWVTVYNKYEERTVIDCEYYNFGDVQ